MKADKNIEALKRTAEQMDLVIARIEAEAMGPAQEPTEIEKYLADLGAKIRDARINAGLSRYELAKRSGVQQYQLKRLEHGKLNPGAYTLHMVVRALDIEIKI